MKQVLTHAIKHGITTAALCMAMAATTSLAAQTAPKQTVPTPPATSARPAASAPAAQAPLRLQSLAPDTQADPFPAVNAKFFTADSPSASTVDSYLHALLGYDANRIWRVIAVQKTQAAGVSKVTALVSERAPNAKVQQAVFFVLPDGKHLIADSSGVVPFGADPYAENRAVLRASANGPALGPASRDFMLVEFTDLQCPHCKDAQATMKRLADDFPQVRIVFENFPLVDIHPFADKAALTGVCVAKKSNEAFAAYVQAVYETQSQLTAEASEQTLKTAVAKSGADPAMVAACAASPEARSAVDASVKLAHDLGIDQTPTLMINGRMMPLGNIPYETLKQIIVFQAGLDGVTLPAVASPLIKK